MSAALAHTTCVMAAQQSSAIEDFPLSFRKTIDLDGEPMIYIDGLYQEMFECYSLGMLPASHGKSAWAKRGRAIELDQKPQVSVHVRAKVGLPV